MGRDGWRELAKEPPFLAERWRGVERTLFFLALLEKTQVFLFGTPGTGRFCYRSGGGVERAGEVLAVSSCTHKGELRQADTQCLFTSNYVGAISRNRLDGSVGAHALLCSVCSVGNRLCRRPSTSIDTRPRSMICARPSRHTKVVAMPLL